MNAAICFAHAQAPINLQFIRVSMMYIHMIYVPVYIILTINENHQPFRDINV